MNEPNVLYEDDHIVVIDKPAGLIVHADGRTEENSVAAWAVDRYPEMVDVGEAWTSPQGEVIPRPGIVHRLDRTTSGVLVLARTQEAHAALKEQFQNRLVDKEYRAFVYGHPKEEKGKIEAEIVRVRSTPPRWSATVPQTARGTRRAAITEWQVTTRHVDPESGEKVALLTVSPKTGRTHQVRVHLKSIHHPCLSDHLYAASKPKILGFERPALHAHKITLTLLSGERMTFEAPLPPDFMHAEQKLKAEGV